jgi:uncharacterized phage-associated protein
MPFRVGQVANCLLNLAEIESKPITPMKLQKLVYLCHGWHLGIVGEPLIDESVRVWRYGPVIQSLYHEFKEFGSSPIIGKRVLKPFSSNGDSSCEPDLLGNKTDAEIAAQHLIQAVWRAYRDFSALQLSAMTHEPGTPWSIVKEAVERGERNSMEIDDELIGGYYAQRVQTQD